MILDLSIGPTWQMLEWDPVLLLEMDRNVCLESGSARLYEDISNLGGPLGWKVLPEVGISLRWWIAMAIHEY